MVSFVAEGSATLVANLSNAHPPKFVGEGQLGYVADCAGTNAGSRRRRGAGRGGFVSLSCASRTIQVVAEIAAPYIILTTQVADAFDGSTYAAMTVAVHASVNPGTKDRWTISTFDFESQDLVEAELSPQPSALGGEGSALCGFGIVAASAK